MKHFLLTCLSFTLLYSCKKETDYLVQYNFTFAQDSLNPANKLTEEMILKTDDNGFAFMPNNIFSSDTIQFDVTTLLNQGKLSASDLLMKNNEINKLRIYFQKDSVNYFIKTQVNSLSYNFRDDVPEIKWQLVDESKMINDIDVKKATTTLFGRNWTAWYADKIPVSYGPYKFHGLPGLILELNDEKNHFHFEAISVVKDTTTYPIYDKYNEVNSKRIEFETAIKSFKNNPVKINMKTGDNLIKDAEALETRKEILKAKNNSIEKGLQFDL
ncbi:GLPGLI family protein [Faecalibacter bovis]|uniref:GLPGLI family protein n=1 Tax=Faecalibacter bovis TaxID=2898187 RepID=A0ABX7XAC8_9FLAO|nr:GLPGLI family protein [Faecalibacter bovis]QTV04819.1 GLPGLI family protein [Faecalibacter bovis]